MIKRLQPWLMVLVIIGICGGVVAAFIPLANKAAAASHAHCQRDLHADEARVHTNHFKDFTNKVPGLGDYVDIHWQYQALSDPCARQPNPKERAYQAIVRLRSADVRIMATNFDWQPTQPSDPEAIPEALVPFVPAGAQWMQSHAYTSTYLRHGDLYLDPVDAVVFVTLLDL